MPLIRPLSIRSSWKVSSSRGTIDRCQMFYVDLISGRHVSERSMRRTMKILEFKGLVDRRCRDWDRVQNGENLDIVGGQWSVVGGRWPVVGGQWSVVSGQWPV